MKQITINNSEAALKFVNGGIEIVLPEEGDNKDRDATTEQIFAVKLAHVLATDAKLIAHIDAVDLGAVAEDMND